MKPDGRLLFSVFLTDPDGPFASTLEAALASDDPEVANRAEEAIAAAMGRPDQLFVDEVPETPLLRARYDKTYALSLVAESGWAVEELRPANQYIQHHLVCRPT